MKFGKSLSNQIEHTLPEWRDKFLSYKELKKCLKLIKPVSVVGDDDGRPSKRPRIDDGGGSGGCAASSAVEVMSKEEADFVNLLEDELEKFNTFFVEKEEEYIIRLKELLDSVARAKDSSKEMIEIRKEIVDFHGEMVLLANYSSLNYTGVGKILKKYDKRTGALLRLPYIQKVLQQPFYTTDLLYKLIKECESMLDRLFALTKIPADDDESTTSNYVINDEEIVKNPKELAEIEYMKSLYMKSTISALRALKEIRSRSSTVSAFSLPPLQVSSVEETWNKFPVFEQLAK